MTRLLGAVIAVLAAAAGLAAGQNAPAPTGGAGLVTLHVFVTVGDTMAAVRNLTAADFELWSDGTPVPIARFSSGEDDGSVLLMVDATFSDFEHDDFSDSLGALTPAIEAGLVANLADRDRLALGVFGRQVRIGPFEADPAAIASDERDVMRMDVHDRYGPSPIWDAVDAGIDALAPRAGRRMILLMTDGRATGNRKSLAAVIDRAVADDVAVSVIGIGNFEFPPDATANPPSANLKLLAAATGGAFASDRQDLALHFSRVLTQLHDTYTLAFAPPVRDGAAHRLQVHVKKVGAQPHHRSQYWAPRIP